MNTTQTTKVQIGKAYRVLPGYLMATRSQSSHDQFAGCTLVARRLDGLETLGELYTVDGRYIGDAWLHANRLQVY